LKIAIVVRLERHETRSTRPPLKSLSYRLVDLLDV